MLIQNIINTAQAPQPARLTSGSAPAVVSPSPPKTETKSDATEAKQSAVSQAAEPQPSSQPTAQQLKNAVDSINKALKQANRSLEFSVDKDTNRQIVKLVDSETGEVIRQFPTDEMLAISHAIDQVQQGLLLKQKA